MKRNKGKRKKNISCIIGTGFLDTVKENTCQNDLQQRFTGNRVNLTYLLTLYHDEYFDFAFCCVVSSILSNL